MSKKMQKGKPHEQFLWGGEGLETGLHGTAPVLHPTKLLRNGVFIVFTKPVGCSIRKRSLLKR
jgi:hypothetical protein